jgi:GNAT superfamily N-acetyltransferase
VVLVVETVGAFGGAVFCEAFHDRGFDRFFALWSDEDGNARWSDVGLGVDAPATADDLQEIASAYEGRSQTRWAVVVAPPAAEAGLDALLLGHGLEHGSDFAKFVRSTERPPVVASELRVERIDAEDADIFAAINVAAWDLPAAAAGWFTGSVGRAGWLHYFCYDGSDPIATAAMYVKDGLAWTSWAATRPDGRDRGAQSALIAVRIRDAADLGCSHIHTETYDEQADNPSQSYRNLTRAGFELAYWRPRSPSPLTNRVPTSWQD